MFTAGRERKKMEKKTMIDVEQTLNLWKAIISKNPYERTLEETQAMEFLDRIIVNVIKGE